MFDFFKANLDTIAVCLILIMGALLVVRYIVKLPNSVLATKIKECLLAWVVEAEKQYGEGTGRVKLSIVYGWFSSTFSIVKNFITLETFNIWVDEALDRMRIMLEENASLDIAVNGAHTVEGE